MALDLPYLRPLRFRRRGPTATGWQGAGMNPGNLDNPPTAPAARLRDPSYCPACPACTAERRHNPAELADHHRFAGHGYASGQGWSHPDLDPAHGRCNECGATLAHIAGAGADAVLCPTCDADRVHTLLEDAAAQ
jgi:hypothetical protein